MRLTILRRSRGVNRCSRYSVRRCAGTQQLGRGNPMKVHHFAAVAALGISVSGCATIIEGTTQPLAVASLPEQGAQCSLQNSQGTYLITTPGTVIVHKTKT